MFLTILSTMSHEDLSAKYPDALSARRFEGGYTFLHRVFRRCVDSGQPVIINTMNLYFQYQYSPQHTSFEEGITFLEGDGDTETKNNFMSIVRKFRLADAIAEGGYRHQDDGMLAK